MTRLPLVDAAWGLSTPSTTPARWTKSTQSAIISPSTYPDARYP